MVFPREADTVRGESRRVPPRTTVSDGGIGGSPLDELFDVLSDRRRRFVLYYLDGANERATREALVDRIAVREAVDGEGPIREHVLAELHHVHLPRLQDAGLVEYDQRAGDVVATEKFDRVRRFLDLARTEEDAQS